MSIFFSKFVANILYFGEILRVMNTNRRTIQNDFREIFQSEFFLIKKKKLLSRETYWRMTRLESPNEGAGVIKFREWLSHAFHYLQFSWKI